MILQTACDAWNYEYDRKISIDDIESVIEGNKLRFLIPNGKSHQLLQIKLEILNCYTIFFITN